MALVHRRREHFRDSPRAISTAPSSGRRHAAPEILSWAPAINTRSPRSSSIATAKRSAGTGPSPSSRNEPLVGVHRVLEPGQPVQTKRAPHQRRLPPDLRLQRAVCTDPPSGRPLVLAEPFRLDARLSPGEQAFAVEPEWIGEVVERHAEPLHGERAAPDAVTRRMPVSIAETNR